MFGHAGSALLEDVAEEGEAAAAAPPPPRRAPAAPFAPAASSGADPSPAGGAPAHIPELFTVAPDALADSEVAASIVGRWQREGLVYRVPPGNNDDWFWLYAAVTQPAPTRSLVPSGGGVPDNGYRGVLVVSNDYMRDHHFSMLAPRSFLKWRERHQATFSFAWDHVERGLLPTFRFPRVYSHRMQGARRAGGPPSPPPTVTAMPPPAGDAAAAPAASAPTASLPFDTWHFPVSGSVDEWIVAWRDE